MNIKIGTDNQYNLQQRNGGKKNKASKTHKFIFYSFIIHSVGKNKKLSAEDVHNLLYSVSFLCYINNINNTDKTFKSCC